jgi:hypothetical protein
MKLLRASDTKEKAASRTQGCLESQTSQVKLCIPAALILQPSRIVSAFYSQL